MKKIEEINNYFIKEIIQNKFLSKKNKTFCTALNYIEHFLTLIFAVTKCISISVFASLIDISNGMMSTIGLNICSN